MELSANRLSGELSSNWGEAKKLNQLLLANNNITGTIPPEIGNLTQLGFLDLSSNHLSGGIPKELGRLSSLLKLYLQNNMLSGPIPQELGSLTKLLQLDLSNNRLNSSIPGMIGSFMSLNYLNLSNNNLIREIPIEIRALVLALVLKRFVKRGKREETLQLNVLSVLHFDERILHNEIDDELKGLLDQRLPSPMNEVEGIVKSIVKIAKECLRAKPLSRPTMKRVSQQLSEHPSTSYKLYPGIDIFMTE
nr:MDIS1-interacting receptor like kinase 2-like [Ipomoea batatas]